MRPVTLILRSRQHHVIRTDPIAPEKFQNRMADVLRTISSYRTVTVTPEPCGRIPETAVTVRLWRPFRDVVRVAWTRWTVEHLHRGEHLARPGRSPRVLPIAYIKCRSRYPFEGEL